MALPININEVLHRRSVESERLEFRAGWNPEDVLHTLCAFANDFHNLGGGYIFIGIAEDRGRPILPPVSLDDAQRDAIQKEVLNVGHRILPAYHPVMEPCVVSGRAILLLRAPGGQLRPYKAPGSLSKENRAYPYYIRKGAATVRATPAEEIELISLAAQIPFDDRMNQQASILDLNLTLIQAFLRDVGSDLCDASGRMDFDDLCRRMGLIDGPTEMILPRNVGLMFFHLQPERFFKQTQIDVVQFPDGPGGDTFMEKTFRGSLGQMLRDALLFLSNTVIKETVIKYPDRAEADRFFNYPYAAIEEILVNAVYHRSYEIREPIEVRVLPDKIMITSYPGPDRSIALGAMERGELVARRYRNRRIGEFLKELNLTEGRNTGLPKLIREMRKNGSPKPKFKTDADRSYFAAILPIHTGAKAVKDAKSQVVDNKTIQITTQVTGQVTGQVSLSDSPKLLDAQAQILLTFCESPRDRASIQARLGIKSRAHLSARYLTPLLNEGLIVMTNPNSPQSPTQKYRTTAQGLAALREKGQ